VSTPERLISKCKGKKSFSHLGVNLLIDRPAQAIASPAMYALYHLMESMPTQMSYEEQGPSGCRLRRAILLKSSHEQASLCEK
jgi:hypothetical protein